MTCPASLSQDCIRLFVAGWLFLLIDMLLVLRAHGGLGQEPSAPGFLLLLASCASLAAAHRARPQGASADRMEPLP